MSLHVGRVADINHNSDICILVDSNRGRPLALSSLFNHLSKGYTALSQDGYWHHTHAHTLTQTKQLQKQTQFTFDLYVVFHRFGVPVLCSKCLSVIVELITTN